MLGLLAELAAARPVLLILEDLHWADRSTRDLVTFLSRVLHRERVAVVVTYRTDDLHRRHPLRPVVAELPRLPSVTSIELGPLGYADMADHLTALAAGPLDTAALHRIVARAEGNPYYAEELLTASTAAGGGPDVLPSGLAALLLARVERLSAAGPAGAARGRGRRPPDRRRHGAGGVWPGRAGLRGRGPGGVAHQLLVPGRRRRVRVPARAAPRGALRRPAAR